MARQRLSIGWLYTFCACTTESIHAHGMRASPMSSIAIIGLSIARIATSLLRRSLDSNNYVSLMWPYHLQLLTQIQLMSSLKQIRQIASLSTSNIFASRSMIFWRNQIPSTSSDMINIGCHTSFRWRQCLGAFAKGMPYQSLSKTYTTSIWSLNHYQGYGRQWIWAQHSPIP